MGYAGSWVGCCGVDQWCLTDVCKVECVQNGIWLRASERPIGVGDSPGSGFLSVADMSITVIKGDVKLHSTISTNQPYH